MRVSYHKMEDRFINLRSLFSAPNQLLPAPPMNFLNCVFFILKNGIGAEKLVFHFWWRFELQRRWF